jgi:hypothetical protein
MSDADIVYKTTYTARDRDGGNGSLVGSDDEEPFSAAQTDIICRVLAMADSELRRDLADHSDLLSNLRERVAMIEGQVSILMSLLGGDSKAVKSVKTIEASETVRKRKMRVT